MSNMSNTLKIKMLTAISFDQASHSAGDVVEVDEKSAVRLVRSNQADPVGFDMCDYDDCHHDVVEESMDASVVKDDDAPTDDDPVFEADENSDIETSDDDDSDVETREE